VDVLKTTVKLTLQADPVCC